MLNLNIQVRRSGVAKSHLSAFFIILDVFRLGYILSAK